MQLKKILAIFLAAALIFSIPTVSVGAESTEIFEVGVVAETTAPVSTSPVIYQSGDEVSVKISAAQNTGVDLLKFKICYDRDVLEFVDYTSKELFGNETITLKNDPDSDYLIYNILLNEVSTATGELLIVNFKVKDTICGDITVSAELFGGRAANCKNGANDVPFVGGSASFAAHAIDLESGVVTDPTCVDEGYTTYKCSICEEDVVGNTVAANGHTEAEAVKENIVDSDCVNTGSYDSVVYCSVCDVELSRETLSIDAKGHTEAEAVVENRVEPDCTNAGSYDSVVYCSVCDAELSRETLSIDALGHDYINHGAKAPTCTEIGWDAYDTCSRCDYTTYVEKESLGHDLTRHAAKAPTCTEIGWDAYDTCSRCDYTTYVEKESLGHDLINHEAKAPTCTEVGWDAYDTCSRCDYTTYVEKLPTGHSPVTKEENRVEPDCTNAGSYDSVVYCSVCDAELSREKKTIAALGHATVTHDAKAPTCTEIGWDAYDTCARCDYTTYVEKAALGHKNAAAVEENRVEATCLETGSYDSVVYCSVCNVELSRETKTIAALGHDTVSHTAKAPTCTEIGWDAYETCSRCDYTTYVEKAALGHSYDNNCDALCNACDFERTVPDHIYYNACDTTCNECGVVRTVVEHAYSDCFKGYEVVMSGESTISVDTTGVYIVTLDSADSEFSVHDIAVFDKEGYAVIYNEKFGGWPLVKELDYTVKFRYNCEETDATWNLKKIGSTIFADTVADAWYNDAVTYAVGRGVIGGYDNGMFGTADSIQRQDFLVMLARLDGADLSKYADQDSAFPDVVKDSYYEAAVIWGAEKGIVGGYDNGKFGVGDVITREQLVTFLYRYANYKGIDTEYSEETEQLAAKYDDFKNVSSFATDAVLWALENGVIKGKTETTIAPYGNAQRCEVAQIIYNIFLNGLF